jgi:hypothetical protein
MVTNNLLIQGWPTLGQQQKHTWTIPIMMKSEQQQNGNQQQKVVKKGMLETWFLSFQAIGGIKMLKVEDARYNNSVHQEHWKIHWRCCACTKLKNVLHFIFFRTRSDH